MRTIEFVKKSAQKPTVTVVFCVAVVVIMSVAATCVAVAGEQGKAKKLRVVVDAGHGGFDGGVVGTTSGVRESELNLEIAFMLGDFLESAGIDVVYTRTDESSVCDDVDVSTLKQKDMAARKKIIDSSEAVLVVSVHQNFYPKKYRRGSQVFYGAQNDEGKKLATAVQNLLNRNVNSKTALRNFAPLVGDYYMVNCTSLPSVIVECGFLSNPDDEKLLLSFDFKRQIAYNVCCGILSYLSQARQSGVM